MTAYNIVSLEKQLFVVGNNILGDTYITSFVEEYYIVGDLIVCCRISTLARRSTGTTSWTASPGWPCWSRTSLWSMPRVCQASPNSTRRTKSFCSRWEPAHDWLITFCFRSHLKVFYLFWCRIAELRTVHALGSIEF